MRAFLLSVCFALAVFGFERNVTLNVKGMSCPTCTRAVKLSLQKADGVKEAKVYLNTEKAIVTLQKDISLETLLEAVKKVGYDANVER